MAGIIRMSPDEVVSISKVYSESSQEIDSMLAKLRQAQAELATQWEGDAFASFEEQFNALAPKVQDFSTLMMDINAQLIKIAEIVRDTDAQIGQTVRQSSF